MKKSHLKSLALMGVAGGLIVSAQTEAKISSVDVGTLLARQGCGGGCGSVKDPKRDYYNPKGVTEVMSESRLMQSLDDQHKKIYRDMSPDGKTLARRMAGRSCAGLNDCKGLNSCKSDKNSCAGKGSCKGQSKCSFTDKNKAIDVTHAHMQNKRMKMQGGKK